MMKIMKAVALCAACWVASLVPALCQVPVTDIASITQRAQNQVQTIAQMVQQLEQLRAQLQQAKAQYQALTGSRGMGQLLGSENYSVAPDTWQPALGVSGGTAANIKALSGKILQRMNLVDPGLFGDVDRAYGTLYQEQSEGVATYQATQAAVYGNTAKRFDRLKTLIRSIDTAKDVKAIDDLNARIGAESVMLQNEQLKMQALAQLRAAQQDLQRAQMVRLRTEQGKSRWVNMEHQP